MALTMLRWFVRSLLWLRYSIAVRGFDELAPYDGRAILFLPNHPGLIDPILVLATLTQRFDVAIVANRVQLERPVIGRMAALLRTRTLEDPRGQREVKGQIEGVLADVMADLNHGQSYLVYPAGRISKGKFEELGANRAAAMLLHGCPNIRVVLVRTSGLWGSSFTRASGRNPLVAVALRRGLWGLVKSFILFMPRRKITLEFVEPEALPREAERHQINRYLERFYNERALGNLYVPYSFWERGGPRVLAEPEVGRQTGSDVTIPEATRRIVLAHLEELTGLSDVRAEMSLATELGLDSLSRVNLQLWIEREFGFAQSDGDVLETVEDVLLAACGEGSRGLRVDVRPIEPRWFARRGRSRLGMARGNTIQEAFLNAVAQEPGRVVCADSISGTKTYRELLVGIFALKDRIVDLDGQYVGIMLPASVAASVTYLATLFAGKIPVMLNWTTGPRGVEFAIEQLGIRTVISAERLLKRLVSEGFGECTPLLSRLLYLDEVTRELTLVDKIRAIVRARCAWRTLYPVTSPDTAVVLFTSGSEDLPKAVPLSHANLLANDRDVLRYIEVYEDDVLLSMLPPFHSFGLTVDLLLPLLTGLRVVFHANPTESAQVAALVERYRASLIVGTPTFLRGVVAAAESGALDTLRLAVTGAESCSERVFEAMRKACPRMTILEGYGITECSPVVSVNVPGREACGTIGEVMPSLEWAIVDPETLDPVATGEPGLLLVRGPSVFSGYLKDEGGGPFAKHAGKSYFSTGDLVRTDEDGKLIFVGRLRRFVKIGGEMVSLPAIEHVLESKLAPENAPKPSLAAECMPGDYPELVLFVTFDTERPLVNRLIGEAGLSALHNIRRVERLDAIPVLGSGKTDYRALRQRLVS